MISEFVYDRGVHLAGTSLWMDAIEARSLCFVSSGWNTRQPRHERIVATPPTVRFCRQRIGRGNALMTPYNRPFSLGNLRLELMPAGTMLGAAQLSIEEQGERTVYAGRLGPLEGIETALAPQSRRCDRLVLEAPRGVARSPEQRLRARERLLEEVQDAAAAGEVTVILCKPLGLAQEIIAWCQREGFELRAHASIARFAEEYRRFGVDIGACPELRLRQRGAEVHADVVLFPTMLARSPILERLARRRFLSTDTTPFPEALPLEPVRIPDLESLASIPELVRVVQACTPEEILVTGEEAATLVAELRACGSAASILGAPVQGELFAPRRGIRSSTSSR